MPKVCQLTGARPQIGHNVSHSNRKTLRRFEPHLITKRIVDPVTKKTLKVKMTVRAQKTLLKNPHKFNAEIRRLIANNKDQKKGVIRNMRTKKKA